MAGIERYFALFGDYSWLFSDCPAGYISHSEHISPPCFQSEYCSRILYPDYEIQWVCHIQRKCGIYFKTYNRRQKIESLKGQEKRLIEYNEKEVQMFKDPIFRKK
jgi:hypothetical protein